MLNKDDKLKVLISERDVYKAEYEYYKNIYDEAVRLMKNSEKEADIFRKSHQILLIICCALGGLSMSLIVSLIMK